MNSLKLILLIAIPCHVACQAKVPGFKPLMPLPKVLHECSGLLELGDSLYVGLNDSGNKAGLYVFSKDQKIPVRFVAVKGADNTDWEELTADADYLYIGDTGNNSGQRRDLVIYKVRLQSLLESDVTDAERIHFSYADQEEFKGSNDHNFDCEAMISLGDSLYLFTKNRGNGMTDCYACSKIAGSYSLVKMDSFDAGGLVTGAAYDEANGQPQLAMIGYAFESQGYKPFVLHFTGFAGNQFFSGQPRKISFEGNLQTETILFLDQDHVLITNEAEHGDKGYMYSVSLKNP